MSIFEFQEFCFDQLEIFSLEFLNNLIQTKWSKILNNEIFFDLSLFIRKQSHKNCPRWEFLWKGFVRTSLSLEIEIFLQNLWVSEEFAWSFDLSLFLIVR